MQTKSISKCFVQWARNSGNFLSRACLLGFFFASPVWSQSVSWAPLGASPNTGGQTENVTPNNEVVGAVNAVAVHPSNADIMYVGAVNGGIWKTENAMAPTPAWKVLTDELESLSVGAIEFDPTDETHKTLVAGSGGNSSIGASGARIGVLRTVNGTGRSRIFATQPNEQHCHDTAV